MPDEPTGTPTCEVYVFDGFEASAASGILLRDGKRLHVQDLPFRMLIVLLERSGEIVTKEELVERLWGRQIAGATDQSLYIMAGKLRQVLGDDATYPRYIKTISGQGYRFIASVKFIASMKPVSPSLKGLLPLHPYLLSVEKTKVSVWQAFGGVGKVMSRHSFLRPRAALMVSAIVLLGISVIVLMYRYEHRALLADEDKIVVAAFANSTGRPDLDRTLSSALRSQLLESPFLDFASDQRYQAAITSSHHASLQDELRACAAIGGQVLLKGRIAVRSDGYRIILEARRCATGSLLTTQQADFAAQADMLSALDLATVRMRRRLGEPETSLKQFNVPAVQATTASLAALKAFDAGEENHIRGDQNGAIASYKLAVDLDPEFALAYARLGTIYHNLDEATLSNQFYRRAYDLRSSRASDREKLYIVAHYYEFSTGEVRRAIGVYELWHKLYPRDPVPIDNLAGEYTMAGQPQRALDVIPEAMQLDPENQALNILQTQAYLRIGNYAKLKTICDEPATQSLDSVVHRVCFEADFARDDKSGMQRELHWAQGNSLESLSLADAAWVAMERGRSSESAALFRKAQDSALQNHLIEFAADIGLDRAMLEAEVGLLPEARRDAQEVLKLPFQTASEHAYAALVLARAGDNALATNVAKKAAGMAPLDDLVNNGMLPAARAVLSLHQDNPEDALHELELARPLDFYLSLQMLPTYYRGLAYLRKHQPELAAIEFESIVNHRALLPTYSIYLTLAELQLGRAYQLLGDQGKADHWFTVVGNAWQDADMQFPPLRELSRYERLVSASK